MHREQAVGHVELTSPDCTNHPRQGQETCQKHDCDHLELILAMSTLLYRLVVPPL